MQSPAPLPMRGDLIPNESFRTAEHHRHIGSGYHHRPTSASASMVAWSGLHRCGSTVNHTTRTPMIKKLRLEKREHRGSVDDVRASTVQPKTSRPAEPLIGEGLAPQTSIARALLAPDRQPLIRNGGHGNDRGLPSPPLLVCSSTGLLRILHSNIEDEKIVSSKFVRIIFDGRKRARSETKPILPAPASTLGLPHRHRRSRSSAEKLMQFQANMDLSA